MEDSNGKWLTSNADLERIITSYFEHIFATNSPFGFSKALDGIIPMVTESMNRVLEKEPTGEYIRSALFQMHPTKAPGIDGFHAIFFQKFLVCYWL